MTKSPGGPAGTKALAAWAQALLLAVAVYGVDLYRDGMMETLTLFIACGALTNTWFLVKYLKLD